MSEEKLTSNKLDFEEERGRQTPDNKECYKPISEDIKLENVANDASNMVRENGESAQDGADEKMLGSSDKEALALKDVDVKFISGDPNINGDAKIEIGNVEKAFTGMTKEELMKYANDPFWVKLRWILFIAFWALWIAMLVGAILIIVMAPKCAAPTPLKFFEKGPMMIVKDENDGKVEDMKSLAVQAVVYELPPEETYFVGVNPSIEEKIKKVVEKYNAKDIQVVIDLTPNYVTMKDDLFIKAQNESDNDAEILKAFVTTDKESNWLKVGTTDAKKAFAQIGKHTFMQQFEDFVDVRLDHPLIEEKFKGVLLKLVDIGVKGFRLNNAKHFLIGDTSKDELKSSSVTGSNMAFYTFWDHPNRVYVNGLGDLINKYRNYVHNITKDEGFLTITDSVTGHESVFSTKFGGFGFDLPKLSIMKQFETDSSSSMIAKSINTIFNAQESHEKGSLSKLWVQLPFNADTYKNLEPSAFYMFVSLLRGVLIAPYSAFESVGLDKVTLLQEHREKVAIQFGTLDPVLSADEKIIGYTRVRVKSGNPGYLVVLNPSGDVATANFTSEYFGPDTALDVLTTSANFNVTQGKKFSPTNIELPGKSAAIFTFVPK